MRSRATLAALLALPAALAGAEDAVATAAAPSEPPAAVAAPSSPAARPSDWSLTVGLGYYEVLHAGVAYHFNDRAAMGLFGGYGVGSSDNQLTVGASFSHAVFDPVWRLQPGWVLKAIYWESSDEFYRWTNLSLVLGVSLATDLGHGLRLALDGGVAFTANLTSDRKQDFTFGSPARWNGSVCLELEYRFGAR